MLEPWLANSYREPLSFESAGCAPVERSRLYRCSKLSNSFTVEKRHTKQVLVQSDTNLFVIRLAHSPLVNAHFWEPLLVPEV